MSVQIAHNSNMQHLSKVSVKGLVAYNGIISLLVSLANICQGKATKPQADPPG